MSETKTITVQGASGMTIEFIPKMLNVNISIEVEKKITILSDGEPRELPSSREMVSLNGYLNISDPEQLALQLAANPFLTDFIAPALSHMTKDYDGLATVNPPVEEGQA